MPLFGKKKREQLVEQPQATNPEPAPAPPPSEMSSPPSQANGSATKGGQRPNVQPAAQQNNRPKLVFHCQQAHGSPTGIITGFTNVKELYQKIAECYDMPASEILFCTLNTHKVDMARLLGGQIGLEDFIFAHVKGQPKEVDITKSEEALGLTITDNGAGYAFIKRIKEGSVMDKVPLIDVGDHIEKINDTSLVGSRHYEVAKMLKEIQVGTTFTMRVVGPMKSGFSNIGPSTGGKKGGSNYGSGKETLRLRSKGPATVEVPDEVVSVATDKINSLLESFMGINDTELSQTIWEIGSQKDNPHDFALAMDNSDLGMFGFTDDFVFDLWGAISDAKSGRLKDVAEFSEQF